LSSRGLPKNGISTTVNLCPGSLSIIL
jgi:hypothetical protein